MEFFKLPDNEKHLIFKQIYEDIKLPFASIEKDWWVVKTISLVFQTKTAHNLVFKGGTSLSKAWNIIERFSEDVDLSISYEFLGFKNIVNHRERFTRLSGVNYTSHFPPNLKPIPPGALLEAWETDYHSMREQMIYGEDISFTELISGLQNLVNEINQLKI